MEHDTHRVLPLAELPVGFERYHRRSFINYQLNRAHALGHADSQDLRRAGASIRTAGDCIEVFEGLSARAEGEGDPWQAASYARVAEFFTLRRSPDKLPRYHRYRRLIDTALTGTGIIRHEVPFAGGTCPAYRHPARSEHSRGVVLVHGGFDSLIEEFFAIWQRIAAAGFDVVAFDGPGQGGARRLGGLTFDHDWERPVGAVIDHFGLDHVSLVGISMGGYWALRAAAHEPRVDRVVSWPPVYDWLHRVPTPVRSATRGMLARRSFMEWSIRVRARLAPTLGQVVDQALFNLDSEQPLDAMDWFLGMNAEHLGSERVTQDVLLMVGENDTFQPPTLTRSQAAALTSARSVTVRVFTADEQADQHCQMGNLGLACDVVTDWLGRVAPGGKT